MWRWVAGAGAALMLVGAGVYWWSGAMPEPPAFAAVGAAPPTAPDNAMPDPPAASEQTREAKRFARYDRDGDAKVTRSEYLASRVKAFERLDTDGDGKLGFDEWARRTTDRFATADQDRSGTLDAREFATTRPPRRTPPRAADCPPPRTENEES
jgi:hypothetical protein